MKWLLRLALALGLLAGLLVLTIWLNFGGGEPYVDLSSDPQFPAGTLEIAVVSDRPIGNAAVSSDGRIFFTIHPESQPVAPTLYEWVEGEMVPYPQDQGNLFETPLGLAIDLQNRLWVIDPGNHGTGSPRLVAFDLSTNQVAHEHRFDSDIAPIGSFLQDLQVSPDGKTVYIADVGFWAKRPALIVYDVTEMSARRLLNRHESVFPQNLLIRNQIKDMSFFGGILEMKTGIDGLALSRDGAWLYYAAMNHDTLYRIRTRDLLDVDLDGPELASRIEAVGTKPLSDGLSIDDDGNVFITDVENQGIAMSSPGGDLTTLIKDERVRWADGLSFGPDGWLYLADSAIPHLVLQGPEHIAAQAPYYIWRFKPGTVGAPGQ